MGVFNPDFNSIAQFVSRSPQFVITEFVKPGLLCTTFFNSTCINECRVSIPHHFPQAEHRTCIFFSGYLQHLIADILSTNPLDWRLFKSSVKRSAQFSTQNTDCSCCASCATALLKLRGTCARYNQTTTNTSLFLPDPSKKSLRKAQRREPTTALDPTPRIHKEAL